MQSKGMKGLITVALAVTGIALIIFALNATIHATYNNEDYLKMQAAREAAIRTDSVIRLLDKAAAHGYYDWAIGGMACALDPGGENLVISRMNDVLTEVNTDNFTCDFGGSTPTVTGGAIAGVTGRLNCGLVIDHFKATESRDFSFIKSASATPMGCKVTDVVSGCQEQPAFSC